MFKRLLIILLIVLPAGIAIALPVKKTVKPVIIHHQLKIDSSKINLRRFNNAAIKKYRSDPAFRYVEAKTGITLWDRFWEWVWHLWVSFWQWVAEIFRKMFGNTGVGEHAASVMKYLILGIAAAALVYVIFKLLGINLLKLLKKEKNIIEVPYTETLENIHEINFDEAIENALAIKNYRLAVRLLYLRSLKQLSDNNLISWKINKTNTTYLNELTNAEQRQQFSIVTRQFEYVWYGDFPVDGQSYQNINAIFQEFKQRIV
jgi:hypothetical protein